MGSFQGQTEVLLAVFPGYWKGPGLADPWQGKSHGFNFSQADAPPAPFDESPFTTLQGDRSVIEGSSVIREQEGRRAG